MSPLDILKVVSALAIIAFSVSCFIKYKKDETKIGASFSFIGLQISLAIFLLCGAIEYNRADFTLVRSILLGSLAIIALFGAFLTYKKLPKTNRG